MDDIIKVGIVGVGSMGRLAINLYQSMENVQIVGIADKNERVAKEIAAKNDISYWTTEYRELLEEKEIDLVDISTPPYTHTEIALYAIRAKKNVALQKPMCLSLKEADALIKEAMKNKIKFTVTYMYRFCPMTVKAKELIDKGSIGKPAMAFFNMTLSPQSLSFKPWVWDRSKNGGMIVDTLTHATDLFRWYFGEVTTVMARQNAILKPDFADNAATILVHKSGVISNLQTSWTAPGEHFPWNHIEIVGSKGAIQIDGGPSNAQFMTLKFFDDKSCHIWTHPSLGFAEMKKYFVECIAHDRPVLIGTPEEGKKSLEVALAIRESAERECIIELPLKI